MSAKNNITELAFILDRSGSMSGLESDTIGGLNAMIDKQKDEAGEVFVSTILFDRRIRTILYVAVLRCLMQLVVQFAI